MTSFHAVMIDETGCEFGVSFNAADRGAAWDYLADNYPESRVDQLEDSAQTAAREAEIYARIAREIDGDDGYYDEDEEEDEHDEDVEFIPDEDAWLDALFED